MARVNFSPGFVLAADFGIDKISDIIINGVAHSVDEANKIDPAIFFFDNSQRWGALSLGYPLQIAAGLQFTPFLGVGHYSSRENIIDTFPIYNLDVESVIGGTNPQLALAIDYNPTQRFSLSANAATFLSNKGTITVTENRTGEQERWEVEFKFFRWQVDGKYLFKSGLSATAGYRVRNSSVIVVYDDAEDCESEIIEISDTKGVFL